MLITQKENTIFKNKFIELQNNTVLNTETKTIFEHIKLIENESSYPGSVAMCKLDNSFLVLENYRYGIDDMCFEFPRGYAEKNETLEECAIRELYEEIGIGFSANDCIQKLGEISINSSYLASKVSIFLIEIKNSGTFKYQKEELIKNHFWLTSNEIYELIKNNSIVDSFTISAMMLYELHGKKQP